jgi:hypothetical protein
LNICSAIERRSVILQNGILGRVVRCDKQIDGSYDIGVRFIIKRGKDKGAVEKWIKRI